MSNPIDADLIDLAEQAFTEATESNLAEDDNRNTIHGAFDLIVTNAIGNGQIEVTGKKVQRLIADHLWMVVNNNGARRTQRFLKDLKSGQLTLIEVESILDLVVVAGKKRRTTLRFLDAIDVQRMKDEREQNLLKQSEAFTEFEDIANWLTGVLAKCGSIPNAIKDHSLTFAPIVVVGEEETA